MKSVEKLDFLNGLKTLSCILVFNLHFINIFYCGIYSLNPMDFRTSSAEWVIGATPLNLLVNGKVGARMFMLLAGFFAAYRFVITGDRKSLTEGVFKKYFRLVLPILTANLLVLFMLYLGLFHNNDAAKVIGSQVFSGNYYQFAPSFLSAVKESLWSVFTSTSPMSYNAPTWFIFYEFWGTILVAAILSLAGSSKARYAVYLVAAVLLVRTDFLTFICGLVVCDLTYREPVFLKHISGSRLLMAFCLLVGVFLCTFPPIGNHLEGTIYQMFPQKTMLYYAAGSAMILYALLHLKGLQKVLEWKPFTAFSKYSYCFYLLHFPILCTFACGVFLALNDVVQYPLLVIGIYILSFVLTLLAAYVLHTFVERPGLKMADRISKKITVS